MAVKIITDSASDFEPNELLEKDVASVPLTITFGDTSYLDGVDLSKDQFYGKLLGNETFPKTAQPSPEAFLEHFQKAKENGDSVVAILLSSGLSGTVQSANIAKGMIDYDEIYIVDSLSAVTGIRGLLDIATKMRDEGSDARSIYEKIQSLVGKIRIICMVDTLEYLHKGGRLTKTQARLGELANLKPLISLNETGQIFVLDKCLGKNKAYKRVIQATEKYPVDEDYPIYFIYTHDKTNCEKLAELVNAKFTQADIRDMYNIGPTIGAHLGVGAVGITYIEKV